jgi:hypothetical protein
MADPVEPILVVLSVVAAIAAVGWRSVSGRSAALSRIRGRRVQEVIACPKSGSRALCTLVYRERSDECVGVDTCSAWQNHVPVCDSDCVKLINLGIPLRPPESTRLE